MALFSKKTSSTSPADDNASKPKRDPRKARPWFERAETVADTRNYDYALECYINGLKQDPDNMGKHEALREVSKRRKVNGGKPAGFLEAMKSGGSTAIDKMLHSEKLLAMDPLNSRHARDVMKHAVAAVDQEPELHMTEMVYWIGTIVLELNAQSKKPDKSIYLTARDLFHQVGIYDKAVQACRLAVQLNPDNTELLRELKDLEAEQYSASSTDEDGKIQKGTFRKNIKDADQQQAVQQDTSLTRTEQMVEDSIKRRLAEYEEDPADTDRVTKLVDALLQKPSREYEQQAISVLKRAYEETGQFRFKVRMGDIQMRSMTRIVRDLRNAAQQNPSDAQAKQRYEEALGKQLKFELGEFAERVKNYPTDISMRFEYGRRLFALNQLDEAIGAFQQAKSDPKHRTQAHWYLAQCYMRQNWYDEAIDTIREGIENHQGSSDDRIALELRYLLMESLEAAARRSSDLEMAKEAQKTGSSILQSDINFREIRGRMNEIRTLVDELQKTKTP